jgi:hypothetical protein
MGSFIVVLKQEDFEKWASDEGFRGTIGQHIQEWVARKKAEAGKSGENSSGENN